MNASLRLPDGEKEIKIKNVLSKNNESFIDITFFEEDEERFNMKINKSQLDFIYETSVNCLGE